jgi:putative flippase GtrA
LTGGTVALVYLTTTTVLADVVGLPFQAALPIGYCIGLVVHFTLQRVFVWAHTQEFALALHHQLLRYLTVAAVQYGLTAASTSLLPGPLGAPTEVIYVATVALLTATNFVVFRHGIFYAKPTDEPPFPFIEPDQLDDAAIEDRPPATAATESTRQAAGTPRSRRAS